MRAPPWPAIAVRILLVGAERVLLRVLGSGRPPAEVAAAFFGVAALVLTPFAAPWAVRDWSILGLAVPSGLVYAAAYWLYVAALTAADVSAVAPLGALAGVFVVLLAFPVHGERLSAPRLGGAGLVAAGAAQLQRGVGGARGGRPPRRAVWQMTGYAVLTAATRMLDKAGAGGAPPALYAWVVFTVVALAQCAALAACGRLRALWRLLRSRPLLALAAGTCNGGSFLLLVVALQALPVSVAEPLTALSLLVSAALAWLWRQEPVRARWLPTLAVIGGTWLLVLGT